MMAVVVNLLRWEWFRLRRRVGVGVIFGLLLAGAAAQLAAQTWLARVEGFPGAAYDYPGWLMTTAGNILPFVAVVLAGIVVGGDFPIGTWRTLAARGVFRWQAGLAKLLLLALTLAALLGVIWGMGAVVGLLAAPDTGQPDVFTAPAAESGSSWAMAAGGLGAAVVTLLAYLGLGSVLAVAGRSAAFGIGVGIAIILFESVGYLVAGEIAGFAWGLDLNDYTRWTLSGATTALLAGDGDFSRWVFVAPALGYAAFCWVLTLALLEVRDLRGGG